MKKGAPKRDARKNCSQKADSKSALWNGAISSTPSALNIFQLDRTSPLASEVVEEDAFAFDPEIIEHFQNRLHHHGRSAHEILAILRRLVRP